MPNNTTEPEYDVNRIMTDAELDDVPGAGFPWFNSDSPVYKTVMAVAAYTYRMGKYFS